MMLRRPRRNRKSANIRAFTTETKLDVNNLIYPLFVRSGRKKMEEIKSMPGIFRWSIDQMLVEVERCAELGIKNFVLFPAVEEKLKDKAATYASDPKNFYLKAIHQLKQYFPETLVMTDIAMDPYSSDGHDGYVEKGEILNDRTLSILQEMALSQAAAGADILGPSDMMDGRVLSIREALDDAGYTNCSIMSYTAKYASAFYGPFREALESAPKSGDKKTYQMDPANKREALLEGELDFNEGADFLMVKPALAYLDIIHLLKEHFPIPIAAYNVSGEYAMIKAASAKGWLDYEKVMMETLLSIRRAGADVILTYFAKDFAIFSANNR